MVLRFLRGGIWGELNLKPQRPQRPQRGHGKRNISFYSSGLVFSRRG